MFWMGWLYDVKPYEHVLAFVHVPEEPAGQWLNGQPGELPGASLVLWVIQTLEKV